MAIHIVYLSHGGKKYYDQTRFSVLSLLHLLLKQQRQDVKIMVYTDAPDSVPAHPLVRTETLSRTQLQAYRGQFDYVHRIKLEVMLKAARELGTAVLYVDCDTRWLRVPDDLFARLEAGNASCMHVNEGVFGPGFFPDYLAAVDKHGAELRKMGWPIPRAWRCGTPAWSAPPPAWWLSSKPPCASTISCCRAWKRATGPSNWRGRWWPATAASRWRWGCAAPLLELQLRGAALPG